MVSVSGNSRGLLLVNTGNGKGKTTAALGQAVRAAGQGLKVCVIQFIKGKWQTGEAAVMTAMPEIDFFTLGSGFTWCAEDKSEVVKTALSAWEFAKEKIMADDYDLIVLDELTYLLSYKIITDAELMAVLKDRPRRLHLVVTGRDASATLIEEADLVTEMRLLKHPFEQGIKAQKGIEF